jgi:uncharacterized membrane protein
MNKINWTVVAMVGIIALLVLMVSPSLLGGSRYGGWGMMGPGMMGGWGYSPFGWIGMAFMWLIPLGFLTLIVLGIAWVVKATGGGNNPVASAQTCSSCGRGIQADWKHCPDCGTALK